MLSQEILNVFLRNLNRDFGIKELAAICNI
jgi:hypothetical protein